MSAGVSAGAVVAGCGGAAAPNARVASTTGAITAAEEIGAKNDPQAALHLRMAQEQRQRAVELMARGKNAEASWMLARAQADAELAIALAREAQTRAAAEQAISQIEDLKSQL
ncbi:MAG: DUF4398 domain-containing protein [Deltaproteobacteria bacterium]|nr:DUF4398 domain-containing protein [Deltaproteobacteria bacterium]